MLTIPWNSNTGWGTPEIKPCEPPIHVSDKSNEQMLPYVWTLLLLSSITLSHCKHNFMSAEYELMDRFEGMKAYRQEDDTVRLFRPDKNMARMNRVCSFHGRLRR
jgi:branched-chain amino acid aminotransferase